MNQSYAKYLNIKTADSRVISEWEKRAVWIADTTRKIEHVMLLVIGKDTMCGCRAVIDRKVQPPRVFIDKMSEDTVHGLSKLFTKETVDKYKSEWDKLFITSEDGRISYDDYNDIYLEPESLNTLVDKAIGVTDTYGCDLIVVGGEYADMLPLLYAFQRRVGAVRKFDETAIEKVNTSKRVSFPDEIGRITLSLNRPGVTVESIMTGKCEPILIPLDDTTLSSKFCGEVSWGEVLPNKTADVDIDGIQAKVITIGVVVDIFRNVFLNVFTTGRPSLRIVPVLLPLGGLELVKTINNINMRPSQQQEPERTRPDKIITQADDRSQHESNPQSNFAGTFAFDEVEFPVNDIRRRLPLMNLSEVNDWLGKISKVFDKLLSGEIFLCDTNFWVQENPKRKGEMYYGWLIKDLVDKFKKLTHKPYFEITNDVWDEIERHAGNKVAAADAAKTFITDYVAGMKAVVTPDIRPEMKRSAYADATLMTRIQELYSEGRRLTVITNDRGAIYRWIQGVENNLNPKLPVPAYIRNVNLERLYRLRRDLIRRINELKENHK